MRFGGGYEDATDFWKRRSCVRDRMRGILALTVTPADTRRISIDIDSLLIGSSLTSECLIEALRRNPPLALRVPFWALRGRRFLRQRLAQYAEIDVATLPYSPHAVEALRRTAGDGGDIMVGPTAAPFARPQ